MKTAQPQASAPTDSLLSCVVDTAPGFQMELLRWFATATECAGVAADRIVIHAVRPGDSNVLRFAESEGAHVVAVEPFDHRSPHCNKISGALSLAGSLPRDETFVALLDTDMLVMADPTMLAPTVGTLAGKRVDLANPPIEILNAIFLAAGLDTPPALAPPEATLLGNLNGGLYVLNRSDLGDFANAWSKWASWLLDRSALLDTFAVHVDQVAVCVAAADLGLEITLVDLSWNLPAHLPSSIPADVASPKIIHYHRGVTESGLVETTGNPTVDESITRANGVIEHVARRLR